MELSELQNLISKGESDRLEFKQSTGQRREAVKTACAMLNGLGGFVIIGISPKGEIKGQTVSTKTMEDVANELRLIEPPVFPDVETMALTDEKSVIVIRVSGGGGPYTYDGRPYRRQGPTTSQMPQQQYERLLLERMHTSQRWENQPAFGITIEDLDKSEITRTVDEAVRRNRQEEPGTREPLELLQGLGLIVNKQLTNSAVVLFAKTEKILPNFPQCLLKMARFRGNDRTEFIDNRQEFGNAFDLFIRAQRFLRDHLPVAGRIVPNIYERIDDPLYPSIAIREALANALCHRDYNIIGGSISIAVYDDRLEISNSGNLPFGLTPEDLYKPHASRPWNPLIAQVFYRRGIIETWGRGTIKMRDAVVSAGLPEPQIECIPGEVIVRFFPPVGLTHAVQQESQQESRQESLRDRIVHALDDKPLSRSEIVKAIGQQKASGQLNIVIHKLLAEKIIEYTIPEKPNSRMQKYRLVGH